MKFEAKLHGAKIKDEAETIFKDPATGTETKSGEVLFKDPEVYAKMTPEQRQAETDKLMAFTKAWANTKPLGGKEPLRTE